MHTAALSFLLLSSALSTIPTCVLGQAASVRLTAQMAKVKLPLALHSISASYDGVDSIYILGGMSLDPIQPTRDEILRFDISSETISLVSRLPRPRYFGTVQQDNQGAMYVSGGEEDDPLCHGSVFKYDPKTNESVVIADLPYSLQYGTSTRCNLTSNQVILFGGAGKRDGIFSLDLTQMNGIPVGTLPWKYETMKAVRLGNEAILFGHSLNGTSKSVVKVNFDTLEVKEGPEDFPDMKNTPNPVTDGVNVYINGGYMPGQGIPTNGIVKLNANTFGWTFLPVDNFLLKGPEDHFLIAPGSYFVQKLNRVYFFGGLSHLGGFHDEIWYVDLSPLDDGVGGTSPGGSSYIFPYGLDIIAILAVMRFIVT